MTSVPRPDEPRPAASDLATIEQALYRLAALVVTYERRLIFKGKDAQQARLAAISLGSAEAVLRRWRAAA